MLKKANWSSQATLGQKENQENPMDRPKKKICIEGQKNNNSLIYIIEKLFDANCQDIFFDFLDWESFVSLSCCNKMAESGNIRTRFWQKSNVMANTFHFEKIESPEFKNMRDRACNLGVYSLYQLAYKNHFTNLKKMKFKVPDLYYYLRGKEIKIVPTKLTTSPRSIEYLRSLVKIYDPPSVNGKRPRKLVGN